MNVLTYHAPHWKTERLLHTLMEYGLKPDCIIAAPMKKLNLRPMARLSVKHHARPIEEIAKHMRIPYVVRPHEDIEVWWRLQSAFPFGDRAVIGGARILPPEAIGACPAGIINAHPGAIPANRGLDNILRLMLEDLPAVVTTHFIDRRIDAGRIIEARDIVIDADDEIADLTEKVLDTQVAMLVDACRDWPAIEELPEVPRGCRGYRAPLSEDEEARALAGWEAYRARYAMPCDASPAMPCLSGSRRASPRH